MTWLLNFVVLVVFLVLVLGVVMLWLHALSKGDVPDYHDDIRPKSADEIQIAIERVQRERSLLGFNKTKKY